MKINKLPSLEYPNECFEVSSESPTGLLWKSRPAKHFATIQGFQTTNGTYAGKPAGCIKESNRTSPGFVVRINYRLYTVHRVVYSIFNNIELSADLQVDHIDGVRQNNHPHNLREATQTENLSNRGKTKANTSGHKCVFWCKIMSAWYGKVVVNKVAYRTDYSAVIDEVVVSVQKLREKVHGKFHNHG